MSLNTITPDEIRKRGLQEIAWHPEGIKQVELIRSVQTYLGRKYHLTEHSVKNALWDLQDKFPDLVIKKKLSHRNVFLYPTERLIEMYPKPRPNKTLVDLLVSEQSGDYKKGTTTETDLKRKMFNLKVLEIYRHIELSEIDKLILDFTKHDLRNMTMDEIEMLFGVKSLVEKIRKYRNTIVHNKNL